MSTLTGNYKNSSGEVQGVDVVRERERLARMQLLDDIREPSPQPIFGEPVKVDREDETSRRIKNTLGDFTQVLTNDPKNLIGISRSTGSGHQNGHQSNGYTSAGHPINGYSMPGHPPSGHMAYSNSACTSNGHPSFGTASVGHGSTPFSRPPAAYKKHHYVPNGTSATKQSMPNYVAPKAPDKRINYKISDKTGFNFKPESPAALKTYHPPAGIQQAPYQTHDTRSRDPATWDGSKDQKRANQPNTFNLNATVSSNSTIANLNVCNNTIAPIWNIGPDTPAIQVNPFHLPSNATPSNPAKTIGYGQNTPYATNPVKVDTEKVTNTPAKRNQLRPSSLKIQPEKKEAPIAVETILKEMTKAVPPAPLTAIQTPRTEETGFAFPAEPKEDTSFFKGIEQISLVQPFDDDIKPEQKDVSQQPSKPYVSSLQDDLEMSDSDEEAVLEVKSNPDQFLQSPVSDIATNSTLAIATIAPNPTVSTSDNTKMDANSAESSNSSSSESGDSDSDDSSSESNDSDSSSEASDEEVSSKKWSLSNFVDESQRMHSPRFFQGDAAAKGTLRLQTERMKSLALANMNSMNGTAATVKDPLPLPVVEQTTTFLVPEVPVAAKSEILSPIPSPMHAAVGPRTPPSPSCTLNQSCAETSEDVKTVKSLEKELSATIDPPIPNSPHSDAPLNSCESSEQPGYVQNEKGKKQLRSSTAKIEELNEHESSPPRDSFLNESSICKESAEVSLEKKSAPTEIEKSNSNSVISDKIEPPPENYSIKTRQRVSAASSAKKNKSSENSQKVESENSLAIAKLKHPRACRKPNEKLVKKTGTNVVASTKLDNVEQPKKCPKPETKEIKSGSERVADPVKPSGNAKTVKSTRKNKPTKVPQKEIPEIKKSEPKKRKFAIENFVQSPEVSRPPTAAQVFSPSPERSPLPDCEKNLTETVAQSSSSTTAPSKAPCKSNLKCTEACKNVEKLRRSVRCSERASNNAQTEAPSTSQVSSENKKSSKNLGKSKCRVENLLSIEGVDRLELLSPIPMDPSVSTEVKDSAIPLKIMVCIPFAKLSRLPSAVKPQESENIQGYRSRSASIDEGKSQKKDSVPSDQSTKVITAKRSLSKEVKDKNKAVNPLKSSKSNIKSVSSTKKDQDVKSTSEASGKSKTASNVNKTSIKIKNKTYSDDTENTLPKKRKSDGKDQQIVKKKKVSSRIGDEKKSKESPSVGKSDATVNNEEASKTKILERCDSTGSLSSLCSQQSQRSSKSSKEKKKDSSGAPEAKRMKPSTPSVKDIKQEKEDRPKVHVKKEPRASDKNKTKSRDKASVKDISCAEKFMGAWDDSLTSSQFFHLDEQYNEDSKGKLVTNQSLDSENLTLADWDHFPPDMHKVLKEQVTTLNKHSNQAPIMPMDYYYTEGRKQKQIAEKEKDPFQQAVKYFEAAVLFILTSQQKEEYTKDPQAIYQFYEKTLKYFGDIQVKVKELITCPGGTEFKLLILCLKSQSLLNVKLYNIKIKEIKEQMDVITEFLHNYNTNAHNSTHSSRLSSISSIPSPHSTIPSPASSVATQASGYGSTISSSDTICLRSTFQGYLSVAQTMLDRISSQHGHLLNLHRGHDNWEQADMYMTRSNLREFFKEVADQSEPLTLHSSITELVKYIQKGISLIKKSLRQS